MKRKPLIFAIAPLLVVGAALWGVNYRLDHPPLTKADKEFRALVAGADSVVASQMSCQNKPCFATHWIKFKPLNSTQTREILGQIRLVEAPPNPSTPIFHRGVRLNLSFRRAERELALFVLTQTPQETIVEDNTFLSNQLQFSTGEAWHSFETPLAKVNPRFNKRLNRALDAYLPQRLRP